MVKSEIVSYKCSKYIQCGQKIFELKDGLGTRLFTLLKADHARVYQKSASSYNCFSNWNENLENGPCRSHNGFMVGFIKFPSEIKKMLLQKNTFSLIINCSHLYPFGPDILSYCQTRHPTATVPCIIISHDNILRSQELLSVIGVKEIFWPRRFKAVIQRTGQLSLGTMADFSFI